MLDPRELIKHLEVYHSNGRGVYRGIAKSYFPKWDGWLLIERGASIQEIDEEVIDFYTSFYFYHLKLDQLESPAIAYAVMNFATLHGKRKAIQKLQKVAGDYLGIPLIESLNACGTAGSYRLLLEFMEFYVFIKQPKDIAWVAEAYRLLVSARS